MRKSKQFFATMAVLLSLFSLTIMDVLIRNSGSHSSIHTMAQQVQNLELSDLSLFTEARYTRHLSQADRHAPFQDHPMSFEHFPSGSLVVPLQGIE